METFTVDAFSPGWDASALEADVPQHQRRSIYGVVDRRFSSSAAASSVYARQVTIIAASPQQRRSLLADRGRLRKRANALLYLPGRAS